MGRPKIRIIDDSVEEVKQKPVKKAAEKAEVKHEAEVAVEAKENEAVEQKSDESAGEEVKEEKPKKAQKPGKAKPRSKKYQELVENLDRAKTYPLTEAVDMAKKMSYSKFNATIEAHINTNALGIRGLVSLPYAKGAALRLLCFGPSNPQIEGVIFGTEETIEEIIKGKIDFDLLITTPEWMPKLAKIARILGPRGLMPNPKNGTITTDLKKAVEGFQSGKTEYKTESKAPVIHIAMGKVDQPTEEIVANIKTLLQLLGKTKVKKVTLAATMGPSVKLDLSSI